MTEGPGLEPWLANGFPPPSFVVETERVAVGGAGPPLQNRLLVGGAILGAILLIAGLILMARSGGDDDETALNTAPDTAPTSSIPELTFPPATVFEPSFLVPQETVPTLPVAPQTPITPQPPASGAAAGTTQPPATTKKPGGSTSVPPSNTNTTTSTPTPSTSTTPTTAPLKVSPAAGGMYRVAGPDPCSEGWTIRASVTAGLPIRSVKVRFNGDPIGVDMVRESGRDTWQLTRPRVDRPEMTFTIAATTDGQTELSGAEKVSCPLLS